VAGFGRPLTIEKRQQNHDQYMQEHFPEITRLNKEDISRRIRIPWDPNVCREFLQE